MEEYIRMKQRIFAKQTQNDYLILNYDDQIIRPMARLAKSKVMFFSRQETLPEGVFVAANEIKINWEGEEHTVCSIADLKIFGAHNVENALAACGSAFLCGINPEAMKVVLEQFKGVEHRIELVACINDVSYYNDSKATNPESSIKALEAFPGNVILIAGGRDKNTSLTELMSLAQQKVDYLILIGEATERFKAAAKGHGVKNIYTLDSLDEAVLLAHQLAKAPQIVLFSPACASYDMFNNYEQRGLVFKELVNQLIKEE
jgi:UDP-N-acetylmuramoylalanine--D-glutamate ligase